MASKLLDIPIVVESGAKYVNHHGIKAIKDGVVSSVNREQLPLKKPDWLKIKVK